MSIFSSLTTNQKEAIGLLQVGTFLEYFDLMLYVHMAVLLNELFFPKTDPHTAALLSALAFCSTFILRPFGALIFGYIGDNIGRKTTVIITTMLMSTSCIIIANLPTYAQIGISAAWLVTLCRVIQGLSSMGEIMGAQIYVTEITKPPIQYAAVSFVSNASAFGGMAALAIASLVTHYNFNWRSAFWIGATVAVIGSVARSRLRETPEFIDKKRQLLNQIYQQETDFFSRAFKKGVLKQKIQQEKINHKTIIAYSCIFCGWPLTFYITYMYFNPLLKQVCVYSPESIIFHNFLLSLSLCISCVTYSFLSLKIHPLKITKFKGICGFIAFLLLPIIIKYAHSNIYIFVIQFFILNFTLGEIPSGAIFIKHFPILKRFTATSFLYALTRAFMYIVTSFGLVYLTDWIGEKGTWIISLPVSISFIWGVKYFEKLERQTI